MTQHFSGLFIGVALFFGIAQPTCAYDPPIGIPAPPFGIDATYRMYDNPATRNPALTYYPSSGGGYYTHYVDNTHASATNTDNPYGTATRPRTTIPRNVPPGTIIEVHNGASPNGWAATQVDGVGTADRPIFVRGVSTPRMEHSMDVGFYGNARYIVVEGLSFFSGQILARQEGTVFKTSHIAVRDCDFHGDESDGGIGVTSWTSNSLENIVLYRNVIHDNGVWDPEIATGDQDNHGISVGANVSNVWVLENQMYHNSGDGIQINSGNTADDTHHIYVGKNTAHHNKQAGFWTKTALDVVFSQNTAHGHRPSSSASGGGLGFQYDPKRVWFLFNRSYDNTHGFTCGSADIGGREEFYFIGNVIHDVTNGFTLNGLNPPDPALLIGNTIYRSRNGVVNGYYTSKLSIINTIIDSSEYHIQFPSEYNTASLSDVRHTLFAGSARLLWSTTYNSLSVFQQATGKGDSCLEGDPLFVDLLSDNVRLQATSPAVDAGMYSDVVKAAYERFQALYGLDIRKDCEGALRPIDGDRNGSAEWDLGAYECGGDRLAPGAPSRPRGTTVK